MRSGKIKKNKVKKQGRRMLNFVLFSFASSSFTAAWFATNHEQFMNQAAELIELKQQAPEDQNPGGFKDFPPFIQAMPERPDPFVDSNSLYGRDRDNNGLRDDLQLFIAHKFPHEPDARASFIQLGKAYEAITRDNGTGSLAITAHLLHNEKLALKCVRVSGFSQESIAEVKGAALNNKKRQAAYDSVLLKKTEIPAHFKFPETDEYCNPLIL
ncbi:hypothetical protein QTO17_01235, partial [Vibrio owensii]